MCDSACAAVRFPAARSSPARTIAANAAFQLAAWSGGGSARQALPSAMSVPESASSAAMFFTAPSDLVLARMPRLFIRRARPPWFAQAVNLADCVAAARGMAGLAAIGSAGSLPLAVTCLTCLTALAGWPPLARSGLTGAADGLAIVGVLVGARLAAALEAGLAR